MRDVWTAKDLIQPQQYQQKEKKPRSPTSEIVQFFLQSEELLGFCQIGLARARDARDGLAVQELVQDARGAWACGACTEDHHREAAEQSSKARPAYRMPAVRVVAREALDKCYRAFRARRSDEDKSAV